MPADTAEIKVKRDEFGRLNKRCRDMLEANPQGFTPQQQEEFDVLLVRSDEVKSFIDTALNRAAAEERVKANDRFLSDPERTIPHGINGDDDDQKALRRAGWEVKSGIYGKETSVGVWQPMFPEAVLTGAMPTQDAKTAEFYRTVRASITDEYKVAYSNYIRQVARTGDPGLAMQQMSGAEQKALSEGLDTAGGFTVPVDTQAEMLARTAQMAVMRKHARVITTGRDSVRFPAVAPNSTSGSIYSSGFVGGWVGETPAFSDTDPAFQTFEISIKKVRVATKLSNDLVADAQVNLLSWLAENGAENLALVEDQGFIAGNGAALQPLGILNCGASTKDVEGATSNTLDNSTSNAGSAPKLIDLVYAVPSQYVGRASWLMCRAIEGKIRKLVDFQARFLWPMMSGSAFAGTPRTLMDYPIDNSEFVPTDGTDANKVLIFGDLSAYIIAQRAQMTSVVLRERFADTDQIGLILFERVGGGVWNTDAIRFGIV